MGKRRWPAPVGVSFTVQFDDRTLEVEGSYTPSTPDVHYLRNGDPGYPGDPAELEITKVVDRATRTDVTDAYSGLDEFYESAMEAAEASIEREDPEPMPRDD